MHAKWAVLNSRQTWYHEKAPAGSLLACIFVFLSTLLMHNSYDITWGDPWPSPPSRKRAKLQGGWVVEGAAMVRGCAAHFGFALVSRGSPGLPFVASCLPPVDHLWPVARSKPGLQTSFNNYFYFFLTERDLNSNIEETKNVFPTACHRLLPSLPCLSPSLQPGWTKKLIHIKK